MTEIKKVAVTGGAGFIGSHLCEGLVESGYRVVIIDDLSSGKMENINHLLADSRVEFVEGSVANLQLLKKAFRGVSCAFHLAAISSVPRSFEKPQVTQKVNLSGTLNTLLAASENGARKVVYASSAAVYGDAPGLPKKETMTLQPLSPYAITKLAGEYYCDVFQRVHNLPAVCLRYFNVYGPRQDPESHYGAVVPRFVKSSLAGVSPVIFGDGEQTRDLVFVKDVVKANILVAEGPATGILNIANGQGVSVNYLANLICNLVGTSARPVYATPRTGDVKHSSADISRAKAIGYLPEHTLEEGLRATIQWFEKHQDA